MLAVLGLTLAFATGFDFPDTLVLGGSPLTAWPFVLAMATLSDLRVHTSMSQIAALGRGKT